MRSVRFKLFILFLLLGTLLWTSRAFALDGSEAASSKSDLNDIKTRLAVLEGQQKEVLAKEDKILEELDRIRIWVHRK